MNYKIVLFAYFHHFSIWLNIHVLFIKIFPHHSLDLSLLWEDITSFARCFFRFFDTVRLQFECFQSSFVNFGFEVSMQSNFVYKIFPKIKSSSS